MSDRNIAGSILNLANYLQMRAISNETNLTNGRK